MYHLHGTLDMPESIVLTEDDYLDFLVAVSATTCCRCRSRAHSRAPSLLFLGYKLADAELPACSIAGSLQPPARPAAADVAVQLPPIDSDTARAYLARYFNAMSVIVYWGDAAEFAGTLREKWVEYAEQDDAA